METITKTATVKVMLSHNYNHFETSISLENEEGIKIEEIDEARKDCSRLCDKAIKQYEQAIIIQIKRCKLADEKRQMDIEVKEIKEKDKEQRTVKEKATVKAFEEYNWELRWDYDDIDDGKL